MKKRILSMLAAAVLCLAIIAGFIPSAVAFSDVSDDKTALAVETLSGMGVVSGDGSGNYYPDAGLTRAQFCKMAVLAEGHASQVSASAYKTLFSDVPGSSWSAPYVNLAYSEGLISGYGNGLFGPDDPISVSQAVTIALHLLGYSNSDIGPFWPEDYMSKADDLGLLDGASVMVEATMTRGQAALLLYNLLSMSTTQDKPFYQGLAASTVTGAVLTDSGEITVYANNALTDYTAVNALSATLVGERGTLLLDNSGRAVGFLPDDNMRKTATVTSADADAVNAITIGNSTTVVLDEERTSWQDCWYDLRKGDEVVIYYSDAGTIDLLWVKARAAAAGSSITGYYEDAHPNTAAPGTITVLGASLTVTDEGRVALKGYSIGDKITVTLDAGGKVTDAGAATSSAQQVGVLKNANTSKAEVELLSGVTVSGTPSSTISSTLAGNLVKVSSSAKGKISVSALSYTAPSVGLSQLTLAENVKVYERVNGSALTEIDLSGVPTDAAASAILHAGTNATGSVDLLVLNNVTGAAYTYGILVAGTQQGGSGSMLYTNTTVAVENSAGTGTACVTGISFKDGAVGGVAATAESKAASIVTLTAKENLTRADFSSDDSVAGMPLAEALQVYNTATDKWVSLSSAKAFTDSFTAYYDAHGVVRVLFAQ